MKTCRDLDIRKQINHHLHITLTEFSYPSEELEIYFSLYSTKENCYVSEKVLMPALPSSENNDQGLFTILKILALKFYKSRECVSRGAAGARTRRSLEHHLLHPQILMLLVLSAPTDFEVQSYLL